MKNKIAFKNILALMVLCSAGLGVATSVYAAEETSSPETSKPSDKTSDDKGTAEPKPVSEEKK